MSEEARPSDCPDCGSKDTIECKYFSDPFEYGDGVHSPKVTLDAVVPFHRCAWCGFEFTDWEAEEIRQKIVEEYLKKNNRRI